MSFNDAIGEDTPLAMLRAWFKTATLDDVAMLILDLAMRCHARDEVVFSESPEPKFCEFPDFPHWFVEEWESLITP